MKIFKYLAFTAVLMSSIALGGCRTEKIIVIDREQAGQTTNQTMKAGFGGETYIWSNWFFSTNRVENVK